MEFGKVMGEVKSRLLAALAKAPETAFDLEEALLLGNGRLGAALVGSAWDDTTRAERAHGTIVIPAQ